MQGGLAALHTNVLWTPAGPVPLRDVAQGLRVGERPQLLEALVLDLADPLAGDVEGAADLVERPRMLAVEAVAELQYPPLTGSELRKDLDQDLAPHHRLRRLVRKGRVFVGEELAELRLLLIAHRLLQRHR